MRNKFKHSQAILCHRNNIDGLVKMTSIRFSMHSGSTSSYKFLCFGAYSEAKYLLHEGYLEVANSFFIDRDSYDLGMIFAYKFTGMGFKFSPFGQLNFNI